jgi:hypothetical protein
MRLFRSDLLRRVEEYSSFVLASDLTTGHKLGMEEQLQILEQAGSGVGIRARHLSSSIKACSPGFLGRVLVVSFLDLFFLAWPAGVIGVHRLSNIAKNGKLLIVYGAKNATTPFFIVGGPARIGSALFGVEFGQ